MGELLASPADFREQVADNLRFYLDICADLTNENQETALLEKDGLWDAVQYGLMYDNTAELAAALIAQLQPFIERQGYANEWITTIAQATEQVTDPYLQLKLKFFLGVSYRHVSQFDNAIAHYHQALAHPDIVHFPQLNCQLLHGLAVSHYYKHEYDLANQFGLQALKSCEKMIESEMATILNTLGLIAFESHQLTLATGYFEQAIIQQPITNHTFCSINWMNLGRVYSVQKCFDKAITAFETARHHIQNTANELYQCRIDLNIANTKLKMGHFEAAESIYLKAIKYLRTVDNHELLSFACYDLATVALQMEHLTDAEQYLDDAEQHINKINNTRLSGGIYRMRGDIAYRRKRFKDVRLYLIKAERLLQTINDAWCKLESQKVNELWNELQSEHVRSTSHVLIDD